MKLNPEALVVTSFETYGELPSLPDESVAGPCQPSAGVAECPPATDHNC